MKRVIIESPYAGTPEQIKINVRYARACVLDSLMRGEAPIASHLLYTQEGILRDEIPGDRQMGMDAGHAWLIGCDLVAVYTDLGLSMGMVVGASRARDAGKPIEMRTLAGWGE